MATLADLFVPAELQPHVVKVERKTRAGRDSAGKQAVGKRTIYPALTCAVRLDPAGEDRPFGQPVTELSGSVYIGVQADGSFPKDIQAEDVMTFGTWPDGQTRYLAVQSATDELDRGVVMVCTVKTIRPG